MVLYPQPKFIPRNHNVSYGPTPKIVTSKVLCFARTNLESPRRKKTDRPKLTPYHVGSQTTSSLLSSYFSERLTLKYHELFGPQQGRMGRKQINSPDCCMSPLKSYVLMEPPDENLMKSLATDGKLSIEGCTLDKQTTSLAAAMYKDVRRDQLAKQTFVQELGSTSIAFVDSTPIWKEPESRTNIGNQPGENTLKKELWREFEAASLSSNVLRLDASVFRDTSRKGFLDKLEEVCEDMSSEAEDNIFISLVGRSRASYLRPFSIKQTLIPTIDIQQAGTEPPYPDPITTTSYPVASSP
ncbi:hypothetical protein IFM89_010832 [Coptis chinensis]|uniref:Uncharacterized protein n=1 Tax=Coptis chinensis TaxID=261450 RepID=A0A835HYZ1_9MAGN|nr:hypothetical protein IFM89_010832 [Coptis chinensis]